MRSLDQICCEYAYASIVGMRQWDIESLRVETLRYWDIENENTVSCIKWKCLWYSTDETVSHEYAYACNTALTYRKHMYTHAYTYIRDVSQSMLIQPTNPCLLHKPTEPTELLN